ncbi:tetratricopeptide repeat protein [Streptomyces sp. NPDC003720]|uniref:tetratricopeptide repeat protein n=1 Tax=Streptomyces sp. NPDC003720 TaxID=3364684 RepID=UPI0036A019E7
MRVLPFFTGTAGTVLGPDRPQASVSQHGLAVWWGEAGDAAGAAAAFAELLADRMRVLGPNHPHTLRSRNDLARWQGEAGDDAVMSKVGEWRPRDRIDVGSCSRPCDRRPTPA